MRLSEKVPYIFLHTASSLHEVKIVYASRIPPRRPRTLRTWLRSARNFGNTRFGRFAIFDFLTPKKIIPIFVSFFLNFFQAFHDFRQILEELGFFGRQNQVARWILLQIHHILRSVRHLEPFLKATNVFLRTQGLSFTSHTECFSLEHKECPSSNTRNVFL